jgi:limonene-1,2-epoxide hydrolase
VPNSADTVYRLLRGLRRRDTDAVAAQLHADVEAHGARGTKQGVEEVIAWAKPSAEGALVSSVEVDQILDVADEWVAVAARRRWTWAETGELAEEEPFAVLFRVLEGKVIDWNQTYGSITDAIDAIPASSR